jgi:hypothetical protein
MEHYVGLDVSLKLTAICIVDQTGKIVRGSGCIQPRGYRGICEVACGACRSDRA